MGGIGAVARDGAERGLCAEKSMEMSAFFAFVPAGILIFACIAAVSKGVDVYSAMLRGARRGLDTAAAILPAMLCLFPAVTFLRASGAADALGALLAPLLTKLGVPPETALMMLIRPLSGSAAMGTAAELMTSFGADSLIGRTAAVMLGSSETTFYVISVYFSAADVKSTRWAIPAALTADLVCFLSSAWIVKAMWGGM